MYGLEEDLGIEGDEAAFQVAVAVLFITYAVRPLKAVFQTTLTNMLQLFEAPSNMILKQARPRWYLAFLTLAWGLTATFSGFVQNYAGLIACRLILGLFEVRRPTDAFFCGKLTVISGRLVPWASRIPHHLL